MSLSPTKKLCKVFFVNSLITCSGSNEKEDKNEEKMKKIIYIINKIYK